MNVHEPAEDPRLLEVAESISGGSPVDWDLAPDPIEDAETTAALAELRSLEHLSRIADPTPMTWGPFTISYEIGHGSFGTVYRAVDGNLQIDVALKLIRWGLDAAQDPGRALGEARRLARITHPNVVRIYTAERIGNDVGVSMELVKGQTLDELVERQGPFGDSEALVICRDLCRALAAVHAAGMIHGDVKARNVMRAEGGRTVLMDFGAGRDLLLESPRRRGNDVAGTPIYLAPEVFLGKNRTKASDIYSLGVLLFYLTTGRYPVEGRTYLDVERHHHDGKPRLALRDVRPGLSDGFIQVVERALASNPEDRYWTAGEFEAAIDRALGSEQPPVPDRFRWIRVATAAALIVATVASAVLAWRSMTREPAPQGIAALPASGAATAPVAASATDAYRIDAAFYKHENGTDVRVGSGARVAIGDRLTLHVRASAPLYLYVVNEDEQGESFLLFPLPGEGLTNPVAPDQPHVLPGVRNGEQAFWEVSSAGGREHFLIFASPTPPSPAFERMFASLPRASRGRTAAAQRLSPDGVIALRGVGGLASAPLRADQGLRTTPEFATPLSATQETVKGVWVRQVTLENPK